MQIYQFSRQGEIPVKLDHVDALPDEGFIWLDFTRASAREWPSWAARLAEATIHDDHITDSFNGDHPSFFDGTEDYDMLIFQALTPEDCENTQDLIVTRSAAFFLFERLLITVHAAENVSFDLVKRRFCEVRLRFPSTPFGLTHVVLDTMVDRYLTIVDELDNRVEQLQDDLFNPRRPFSDWRQLMHWRKQAHQLERLCEHNIDALDLWRRAMRLEITETQRVRLNDVREHIQRVQAHADSLQKDVEVSVQLHFASIGHKTNQVMRFLTVMSAIFFPLTLITGIYGMNFDYMPELHWRFGYAWALGLLVVVGAGLLWVFRRRRLF